MPLSEPITLASDWILAAVAVALAVRLHRPGDDRRPQRLWAAAFVAGAAAALAGGVVHGFAASISPFTHDVLWTFALLATGLAGSLVLAGTVLATRTGPWRRAILLGAAGQLAVYLALVLVSSDTRLAVWNGAVTLAVILALALATASHDARRLGWILVALGLSAAGLVVQRAGLTAGLLNHNDICHVLQTAALWPFYRAGLLLRDRSHPASTAQRAAGRPATRVPDASVESSA